MKYPQKTWLYLYGFILALHIIILYPNVFTALVISNQFHCSDIGDKLSPSMIRSVTEMPKIRTKRPKLINQFHRSDQEVAEIGDKIAQISSPSSPTFFYLCITGPMISNQFHCSDSGDKLSPSVIRNANQGGTCSIALTSVECWECFELFRCASISWFKVVSESVGDSPFKVR